MKTLHPELEKWLSLLENDELKQTKGTLLNNHGGMCCLGVFAKYVMELDDIEDSAVHPYDGVADNLGYVETDYNNKLYNGIYKKLEELGVDRDTSNELPGRNDSGSSFKEIANFVRENV